MKRFAHVNADSVEHAVEVLRESDGTAKIIAGGTDLLGQMSDEILPGYPKTVVNIKTLSDLDYIREEDGALKIGALVRLADIARNDEIRGRYAALGEAAAKAASSTIREMGTIAGNICQSTRCWYYWNPDNRFDCMRKGGAICYALNGEGRYHSIFGGVRPVNPPCARTCPGEIDIPSYMTLIRKGDLAGAAKILLKCNPLPAITGRVCPHTCEEACNRGEFDESVSINNVERALGDYVLDHAADLLPAPAEESGRRVAVVGAGPAGLSAAFYLRRGGHAVTVFEKMPEPGGMLRYSIPSYRLPRDVVSREAAALEAMGVEFRFGVAVGSDITLEQLSADYDSVFVAVGAWLGRPLGIPGDDLPGSMDAIEFLRRVAMGEKIDVGERVLVLGGGNSAMDAARTSVRLGAKHVQVVYRRTRNEMPANAWEIEEAEEEGVEFIYLAAPLECKGMDGVEGLVCQQMELGEPDESGRRRPVPTDMEPFVLQADTVIAALGQWPDLELLKPGEGVKFKRSGLLDSESDTFSAVRPGLFVGGDAVSGGGTVIEAFAAGRRAAEEIDAYLNPKANEPAADTGPLSTAMAFNVAALSRSARAQMPKLEPSARSMEAEDALGMPAGAVEAEADRCFNCSCLAVNNSDVAPALIVLGATIKTTKRMIPTEEFFAVGVEKTTVLEDDEIVTEIQVPVPNPGAKSSFLKFALRKTIDFPVVSCAAMVDQKGAAKICLNAVYNVPLRARGAEAVISGREINKANAEAAAEAALEDLVELPKSNYKVQVARALVKRTILACK